MKKNASIIFLAMLLICSILLSACGTSTQAESMDNSIEEATTPDVNLGLQEDTSEQLEQGVAIASGTQGGAVSYSAQVATNPVIESTPIDGWELTTYAQRHNLSLAEELLPEEYRGLAVDWAWTDWGLIVMLADNSIICVNDGTLVYRYSIPVTFDCFIFDASEFNPNAKYRWYAYTDSKIVRISEEIAEMEIYNVAAYDYTGANFYAWCLNEKGRLEFWSPSVRIHVINRVEELYVKLGYLFFRIGNRIYVLDVNSYVLSRQSQEFGDMHPIEYVYIGAGTIEEYCRELNMQPGESNYLAATERFEEKYGLATMVLGNPIDSVDIDRLIAFQGQTHDRIYNHFYIPYERAGSIYSLHRYFKVQNISFNGHNGDLHIEFQENVQDYIKWTSYDKDGSIYEELLALALERGKQGETRANLDASVTEHGVLIGDLMFYIGYDSKTQESYIWVDYRNAGTGHWIPY